MRFIIFFLFVSVHLHSQNVAVLEFSAKGGISKDESLIIADSLRSDLVSAGVYKVLDRNNMDKILKEQSFQYSGCTDSECAVSIGQLLNMQYMIIGNMSMLGSTYMLTVEMIDVEKGNITKSFKGTGSKIDDMISESQKIAYRLSGRELPKHLLQKPAASSQAAVSVNSLYDSGRRMRTAGIVFTSIGCGMVILTAAFTGVHHWDNIAIAVASSSALIALTGSIFTIGGAKRLRRVGSLGFYINREEFGLTCSLQF